jgi:hypothetical protein
VIAQPQHASCLQKEEWQNGRGNTDLDDVCFWGDTAEQKHCNSVDLMNLATVPGILKKLLVEPKDPRYTEAHTGLLIFTVSHKHSTIRLIQYNSRLAPHHCLQGVKPVVITGNRVLLGACGLSCLGWIDH